MPLFEVGTDELIPFRRVQAGPGLYESEIEDLMWANLEQFVGEPLFPVARQPTVGDGIRPDIVALDAAGHVYVIEIKRDIDRRQLAQCLEYAGWARNAALDELAGLFHEGSDEFFAQWIEFTETASPVIVKRPPRVVLVARDFDPRTSSALSYLTENDLPIKVLGVTVYEDSKRRRFIDVAGDHEIDIEVEPETLGREAPTRFEIDGRRIEIADLIEAELLQVGSQLTWIRPRLGETYVVTVGENAQIMLDDGRAFSSPSRAAKEAAGIAAYDGWHAWRTSENKLLSDLRDELLLREAVADVS